MALAAACLLVIGLMACGGAAPTATPTAAPTATTAPTATRPPATVGAIGGTATRAGGTASAIANPAAVTAAYANLQKLDSYHLEITATGFDALLPLGVGNSLTYTIDANGGNQHVTVVDGAGNKQEAYRIGNQVTLVTPGQPTQTATSLPLIFTLPDLLYATLTAPGAVTFTAAGTEQINGRSATKYNGSGQLARLAANPLLAQALAGASGDISGPIWVDSTGNFLVAGELTINVTAPQQGTTKLRMDVTKVGQVGPIEAPRP